MTDRWYRWRDGDTGLYWAGSGGVKASGDSPKAALDALLKALASASVETPPARGTKPPSPGGTRRG